MPNSINSLSPNLRDFLLNRNIISDTIISSGLDTLLQGIGLPSEISHSPEAVQPSESIEDDGVFYKDLNIVINKYQGTDNDYQKISINYLPGNTNSTWAGTPFSHESYKTGVAQLSDYTETNVPANGPFQGGNIREFNTTKNNYLDVSKQTKIDFNTQPVPAYQIGSYLDEYGFLNVGGADTQPIDVIGSVLGGGGVGFDPNGGGVVPDFDVRASLAGRALNAGGLINDTLLGQISASYLASAIGNNIAFNVQQETIGSINLNPLSLLKGNNIIVPNYNITVSKGTLGKSLNLGERMLGFETPVSLLSDGSSIFGKENPVGNIERMNSMVQNTGKGQVLSLIANLNENLYKPQISDDRKKEGTAPTGEDGTNGTLYAFNNGTGGVTDLLNTPGVEGVTPTFLPNGLPDPNFLLQLKAAEGSDTFEAEHGKITSELGGNFNNDFEEIPEGSFNWVDNNLNKERKTLITEFEDILGIPSTVGNEFTSKKSLLNKTQQLFKTNKMKTLVSGREDTKATRSQIQSGVRQSAKPGGGAISKGSGVLSKEALKGELSEGDNVFCRTWSSSIRYDQVEDLVRHSGLNKDLMVNPNADVDSSVLDKQGFPQIGPYSDGVNTSKDSSGKDVNVENYMFSIENLAWYGTDLNDSLVACEIGPGDPLTGRNGRIMWFPPYDMSFNETTSVSLERNNFIGRGEPIYTYNNTERMGTLSWKIIIDHPNYMNYFPKDWKDDEIASFYAGCLENDEIANKILTGSELNAREIANKSNIKETTDDTEPGNLEFNLYFANDSTTVVEEGTREREEKYEDGRDSLGNLINYANYPMGCFKFHEDNSCKWGWGIETTIGSGIVGGKGTIYNDETNFGLNGQGQEISFEDKKHRGWYDEDFNSNLNKYIKGKCKYCRIKINGYASTQGAKSKNSILSQERADNVKDWLLTILKGDVIGEKRVKISKPSGLGETGAGCTGSGGQDRKACKLGRKVTVSIEYDATLKEDDNPSTPIKDKNEPAASTLNINGSRFFSECNYFTRLEQTSPTAYSTLKEKIPYFSPSFHSTTPEGFNSRLTFLQQCTRQGPTLNGDNPNNLAFGRPPVCILRVGDFYNTKIMIESLTIDYEPLVWDLNPEGVGVQPMIANVTMSFVFIGGSSLKGPINKLQNAISFNYFANTELYDIRADVIRDGKIESDFVIKPSEEVKAKNVEPIVVDQKEVAEKIIKEADPEPEESADRKILKEFSFIIGSDGESQELYFNWSEGNYLEYKNLTKPYTVKFQSSIESKFKTGVEPYWEDLVKGEYSYPGIISEANGTKWFSETTWPDYLHNGKINSDGLIIVSIKATIDIPGEENIIKTNRASVAGYDCILFGIFKGQLLNDSQINIYKSCVNT